ncbi:Uncharacterised protein [Chromobacterium violaceum]|uniref:Uncharacterized protein n=1 Tax=Chromobacterium violaceum TaxID=536 RepID=A0A3S5DL81_CHRVL|nr:Uncharacterised protein [Chromobacterium violaceum]
MSTNLLSLVIWTPILAGLAVLATGGDQRAPLARWLAVAEPWRASCCRSRCSPSSTT